MTTENNDARNQEIADKHKMDLLQAEVFFTIIDVMALQLKGTLCYHGQEPPMGIMLLMLKMKADGFRLAQDRFHNHVRLMAAHNLVHNTDQGDKLAEGYAQEQGLDLPTHGTYEVDLGSDKPEPVVPINRMKGLEDN